MAEPLVYSVEQCASALGVSRGTVYNGIRRGEIKSFSVGARRLVSRAEIERLIGTEPKVTEASVG